MTEKRFKRCELEIGPAMRLAKEAQTFKEKLKHAFSSYHSLKGEIWY
jgi:hypothetical protein